MQIKMLVIFQVVAMLGATGALNSTSPTANNTDSIGWGALNSTKPTANNTDSIGWGALNSTKPTASNTDSKGWGTTDSTTLTTNTKSPQKIARVYLMMGLSNCSGRVEVEYNGTWGTVCDDHWGKDEATVVCRELGCGDAMVVVNSSAFGLKKGKIWLDDVNCTGSENFLSECDHRQWGESDCSYKEDAGVICEREDLEKLQKMLNKCSGNYYRTKGEEICKDPTGFRLADGPHRCHGRVEIELNGTWGTVCDDLWDPMSTKVVCEQLQCGSPINFSGENGSHVKGDPSSPIWLNEVRCRGTESVLWGCRSSYWGELECHHKEDVEVVCEYRSLIQKQAYNPFRDDLIPMVASIILAVLLIIVSTALAYQIYHRNDPVPDEKGVRPVNPREYGIYEDIDYGRVKRLSKMSHVSEATNSSASINKLDYYVDEDEELASHNEDVLAESYDDVENGSLLDKKEYYDDVEGAEAGDIELKVMGGGAKEYYDDVAQDEDSDEATGPSSDPTDQAAKEYYDDLGQAGSVNERVHDDAETETDKKQGSYENVPSICTGSAPKTRKPAAGVHDDAETETDKKQGSYENVPSICTGSAPKTRKPAAGVHDDAETETDKKQGSYENVPSICTGSAPKTRKPAAGVHDDAETETDKKQGSYENVPSICTGSAPKTRKPAAGVHDDAETETDKKQGSYENVPSICTGSAPKTRKPAAGDYDDVGTEAGESESGYDNVADCTSGHPRTGLRD
ncbi:scavenger receptor cysteine-rich type 1 protein M130-like [Carcharodon carcharias]|uniref:scavenger receptor cysteine-rich type 1 protein M130-like n=1 Tax=Carcharodon carcharias TaxID=13397 RepID=UPI001B7E6B2B|nr:scavenger receptor cysteine-rich type 1 protein M130-like [Carcharodon carcharias]